MEWTVEIQRALGEGGAKTLMTRSLRKLLRPVFKIGTLVFTECDLRRPMPEKRPVPGILVREAFTGDAKLFEEPYREVFLERLKTGSRCFVGIEEATGKLTNSRWINTSIAHVPELRRHVIMKPGEVYAYDLRTVPEFRRRGIDAHTRHYTYSHLRDTGYTKVYAYIHGDNYPSLQASRHFLIPVARIHYIQPRGCRPIIIGTWRRGFPELVRELPLPQNR